MPTGICARVVRHRLRIENEGEAPGDFAVRCTEIFEHIVKVRLPKALKGLSLWIEPKLRLEASALWLDLLLYHDGQLPLRFGIERARREPPALTEELDRLAATVERALVQSNEIWNLAADIANSQEDPGDEVEHLRVKSGFDAPKKPRTSRVPALLHISTRQQRLALESPETRPEYLESGPLRVVGMPEVTADGVRLKVLSAEPLDPERAFRSRIEAGDVLSLRWPKTELGPWTVLLHLALVLNQPLEFDGTAAISTVTLGGKALEVDRTTSVAHLLRQLVCALGHLAAPASVQEIGA